MEPVLPHPVVRRPLARVVLISLAIALLGSLLSGAPVQVAQAQPKLTVTKLASGLTIPWDLTWVDDLMLINERGGRLWSKRVGSARKAVKAPLADLFVGSEGGLMGMVADPAARSNKRFYVCYASKSSGGSPRDVRVVRWRLTSDTSAVRDGSNAVVVSGLPISSGRHSGCRLRFGPDGKLYVGTGDATTGTNPQDLQSLGGKVLRVNCDGTIPPDNPFYGQGGNARYVYSYGHRNVQGLAFRPGTRQLWTAEHGTYRDDEVNLIAAGANYGWDPQPGYDESVPMTDLTKFPAARSAKWSSGNPTIAPSGITFLQDSTWGRWQGALVMAVLKGHGMRLLFLDPESKVVGTSTIDEVSSFGRIRTVQYGPDRALYFTTSNGPSSDGSRTDVVGRISTSATPPKVAGGTNISPVGVSGVRTDGDMYVFARTGNDRVAYKRSTDDGVSWPSAWTDTALKTTSAPSIASSSAGQVDLATRNPDHSVGYTCLLDGEFGETINLGGIVTTATISSLGDGTLDVFGLSPKGRAYRKHFDGNNWSGWQLLDGGPFTSAIGASAQPSTGQTLITARGETGRTYQRTLTPSSNGSSWVQTTGYLWSGRALGDRYSNHPLIGMSRTYDGMARWQRGPMTMALEQPITSDPDVVTRPDGTWVMFARDRSGGLSFYDARPGAYTAVSLGGAVR
jgi:glucose/arabinose dehydrogenase